MKEGRPPGASLGVGPEFEAIRAMVARWGHRASGIGDDAAVLRVPRGDALVASVDASIENRHFRADWLSAREIGYRAVTAALSDLAAMAASPLGVLVALALPQHWYTEISALADGIGDALDAARTVILGGNVAAADVLSLTTTVLGAAYAPLCRDTLRPGDTLYVTGRLGGPGAAIASWKSGHRLHDEHRARFAHPVARLREARWLADRGATAAIDISDGLAADLEHLAAASRVGVDVDLESVPLIDGVNGAMAAASSGEEYELIIGAQAPLDVAAFEKAFTIPLTAIGTVTESGAEIVFRRGSQRVAKPPGYDHLSR
ncbi:MAG: thiamine-phosphate kinase [Gemmatimonadaceae bacterium]